MVISGRTKVVAVLGHPIGHSLSPQMHNSAFEAMGLDFVYVAFDVVPESVGPAIDAMRALDFAGANVTIPHKLAVVQFLDDVDDTAKLMGNVNTIVNRHGRLIGYNTDGVGISRGLSANGVSLSGARVLCIGAGGVARTVVLQTASEGAAHIVVANRNHGRAHELVEFAKGRFGNSSFEAMTWPEGGLWPNECIEAVKSADIIIQTTPVGMYPHSDAPPPCPVEALSSKHCVFELVYNPIETRLVREASRKGCKVIDGTALFLQQGAEAYRIWTGLEPPLDVMCDTLQRLLGNKEGVGR